MVLTSDQKKAGTERGMKKLFDRKSRLGRSESFAKQT